MTAKIEETVLGFPPPAVKGVLIEKRSVMNRLITEHGSVVLSVVSVETYRVFKKHKKNVQVIRLITTELKR